MYGVHFLAGGPSGRKCTPYMCVKSLIKEYSLQRILHFPRSQQVTHMQRVICRNLGVFPFFVDPFIQNVLSLKPCVQISNRFHRWIPRVEIFKTRSHVDRFWRTFFFTKKTGWKNRIGSMVFFPFRKRHGRDSRESTTVSLAKAKPWLSRKKKRQKTRIFSLFERHGRDFRESTTVPLAEAKP